MSMLSIAGLWLQAEDTLPGGTTHLLVLFVGLVAVALLTQAIAMIAMAVGASRAQKRGLEIAEELRAKVLPVVDQTRHLLEDVSPKVRVITDNLVETSHVVRSKAAEFDATLSDVNERTRAQVARVDEMVTATLRATEEISTMVQTGVKVPVRQFAGLMNGLKAGMDVLLDGWKGFGRGRPSQRGPRQDMDL
ncbi:MAG: hypothetical protein KGK08_12030 [Acidobacteriota bacterium]|nr:hypothetical protein [Acidobacteriota bacterium]